MLPSPFKAGDEAGNYEVMQSLTEQDILRMANYLARKRLRKGRTLSSPEACFEYLQSLYQEFEHDVFGLIYLDQQHRVINHEVLFRGTINQASVYPRELIKQALAHNAAAVILFHNHPSGNSEPSRADDQLTENIKRAFENIEIRVLDHVIVSCNKIYSFAKNNKLQPPLQSS